MASIERQDAQRTRLGRSSGLVLEKDMIATSSESIEGPRYLRIELVGGARLDLVSAEAWTRREEGRFEDGTSVWWIRLLEQVFVEEFLPSE